MKLWFKQTKKYSKIDSINEKNVSYSINSKTDFKKKKMLKVANSTFMSENNLYLKK